MKFPVRPALPDILGNNEAHSTRPSSTYKSGNVVQTTGATSDLPTTANVVPFSASNLREVSMYFILFKSTQNNQWYWNLNADNNQKIAAGAEGYVNKQDAIHGINLVKANASTAKVYDKSQEKWL